MSSNGDRRQLHGERDPEGVALLEQLREGWLDGQFELARLLHRIDRKCAFLFAGGGSVEGLAALKGFHGYHARDLVSLGYALAARPDLEALIREKQLGLVQACLLGEVYKAHDLSKRLDDGVPAVREGDRWVHWAQVSRPHDLKRRIKARINEVREARPGIEPGKAKRKVYGTTVSEETADDLDRCQVLGTKRSKRPLTRAQMLAAVAKTYLHDVDPDEQVPPRRFMPDTAERLMERGVPADVAYELERRSGGLCEFGTCERAGVERCHIVPHADGSPREERDLVLGCVRHHTAYDRGWIRFVGWTNPRPDGTGGGLPTFVVVETGDFLLPKPRPAPREAEAYPEWLLAAMGPSARRRWKKKRAHDAKQRAEHGHAESGHAESGEAENGDAESGDAESGEARNGEAARDSLTPDQARDCGEDPPAGGAGLVGDGLVGDGLVRDRPPRARSPGRMRWRRRGWRDRVRRVHGASIALDRGGGYASAPG